jgi:centromere protein L
LYKFSYANLREYSRLLSALIAAEKHKGLAVQVGEVLNVKVIFSTLLGLKGTQRDPEAVLVQILSKSQLPPESREDKVVWTGWFCCAFGDSLLETTSEDFTCLPLFLANGAESHTAIIGTWFQKTFDCHFSPLAINSFNLSWMAAMWTACKMDHYMATEFLWSVPCTLKVWTFLMQYIQRMQKLCGTASTKHLGRLPRRELTYLWTAFIHISIGISKFIYQLQDEFVFQHL